MLERPGERVAALTAYASAGGRKSGFSRVLVGLFLVGFVTVAASIALVSGYSFWQIAVEGADPAAVQARMNAIAAGKDPVGIVLALGAITVLWPVLWAVLRLLHRQRLRTLFSPSGRLHWGEFVRGAALILAVSLLASLVTGPVGELPERSGIPASEWVAMLLPFALLIFLQSGAEELVFRGYLLQQMALRSRSILVWGCLPSALFCLLHWNPSLDGTEQALYFVATFLFGLLAAITVARTGSLATALGMHWASNMLAIVFVAQSGIMDGAALFVQRGETTAGGLAIGAATIGALLLWVISPLSPVPRRRPAPAPIPGSAEFGETG